MKIKISDDNIRKKLFYLVKNSLNKSWKEIGKELDLPKYTFERYRSGSSLIPEKVFLYFLNVLNKSKKMEILKFTKEFPDNYGQVKGGITAYKINFEKFREGRKKAAISNKIRMKKTFTFDIELSPEICELIGAFIGDGFFNCYRNKLYQIEFSGDSRYDLDYYNNRIIPIIKEIIPDINPRIYKREANSVRIVFYSKKLFCFLRDYFSFTPGRKTHVVKIPEKILNNIKFIYPTIRGIFDTDGGVFFDKRSRYKKPYPRIIFQTVSKNLHGQIVKYLTKDFKIYSFFGEKRKVYGIEIYGHNQLKKWMSLIGFSNRRHLNKIASIA